jgi:hypothetical protein
VAGITPTDAEIEAFLDVCPPKKRAGRNDQMMAVYLPYCDRFVTRDKKQLERLRDVSAEAKLNCEVSSYGAFCADFEVVV